MPELPRGTVTFLFTDIEGSTALWERERAAMATAIARHLAVLDAAISAHQGIHFKTVGDSVQAVFSSAPNAVAAAIDAQRALLGEPWEAVVPLRVRMALHTGEAIPDAHGDYLAAPLNRLSRLLTAGHGEQILLSQAVQQLARDALPERVVLRDLGEHRLRDLLEPERVWQVMALGLPADFPPLASLENRPTNLPRQPTPFLGREQAVNELAALLSRDDVQLVTLTGPGGTGKTRLALQAAAEVLNQFPEGVWFVDLAPLTDPALVASAIASVVGVRSDGAGATSDALASFLRAKQMLLVLDNFEHLLGGAPVVGELLCVCPNLTVLATSRAPLRLRAEREVPVPPLAVPDPARHEPLERLTQYEAVRLFIERALAAKPDFAVNHENAPAVAEICARLDGLPLAIELAAARVRMLPPQALLRRLEHRLSLLTSGARDAPQQQRTLRDAIAWSYDLLAADEQTLFRRLGIFAGGCTLEMAEAVVDPDGSLDVFTGLASLIEESLLRQVARAEDEPRFRMMETIREFALEQLATSGELREVRNRLAAWYLQQTEESIAAFETRFVVEAVERLEADYPNLIASLEWLEHTNESEDFLRLAGAVGDFWYLTGRLGEGRAWLERALAAAPKAMIAARVWALYAAGHLAHRFAEDEVATARLHESVALARQLGLPRHEGGALLFLGVMDEDRGNYDDAERHLLAGGEMFERSDGHRPNIATFHLGVVAYGKGELDRARQLWEDALAASLATNEAVVATWCLQYLGLLAAECGQPSAAANSIRRSVALGHTVAHRHHQGRLLNILAVLASFRGMGDIAARLQGAAAAQEGYGDRAELPERLTFESTEAQLRVALGEEGYNQARNKGAAFRPEELIATMDAILEAAVAQDEEQSPGTP
jgi:predicted ATPase/class 3 adenylate cyclase